MKAIKHPAEGRYGTGNKASQYRCGPNCEHKGMAHGGKDLSPNAKNTISKPDKKTMHSPGPKHRNHS